MAEAVLTVKDRIIRASDVRDEWGLNLLIYGDPGVGKTTLCSTAQESAHGKDVLFLAAEPGTRSIADRDDVKLISLLTYDDLKEIHEFLTEGEHSFRTIVIDSLTEVQRLALESALQTAKDPAMPSINDYGRANELLIKAFRNYRNLAQDQGWTVIFTALARDVKDESTGGISCWPALSPKAAEMVCGSVDAIGHMALNKDGARVLRFVRNGPYIAKMRQPHKGPQIPQEFVAPHLGKIIDTLHNGGEFSDSKPKAVEGVVGVPQPAKPPASAKKTVQPAKK